MINELNELKKRISILEKEPSDVWMDAQDVFEMLHISKRTLQTWRDNGVIPYYSIHKKIWYKRSEINNMLESKRITNLKK